MAKGFPDVHCHMNVSKRQAAWPRQPVAAAAICMAASALFAALSHSGAHLAGATLPVIEVACIRSLFAVAAVLPFMVLDPARPAWRTRSPFLQLIRSVVISVSMLLWFYGLATIPLVEVIALSFSTAIFVTIGAALFLGERVGPQRWSAVVVGLAGALVILRPGFVEVSLGSLAALLGSAGWAAGILMTKRLAREDGNVNFVFFTSICAVILFAPPTLITWETPSWRLLGVMAGMGIASAAGQVLISNALRLADATVTMPIDYTRLVWAALIGHFFFDEQPKIYTWIGAAMITAACLFIAYRESRVSPRPPGLTG